MGVIHKLRNEVVDFIISQKKTIPTISVRQLAALTSQKFQTNISKSSVNSVLKKLALSSSVGRRAGSTVRPEKFSIPETKKKEISKSILAAGFSQDREGPQRERKKTDMFKVDEQRIQDAEPDRKTTELPREEAVSLGRDTVGEIKGIVDGQPDDRLLPGPPEKQEPEEVAAQADKRFLDMVNNARRRRQTRGITVSDGMGFVFLKAAEWAISERPMFGELLKSYIQSPVSKRFDIVSNMFLFFKFFGAEDSSHLSAYRGHGLWILNHFCHPPVNEQQDLMDLEELFLWDKKGQDIPLRPILVAEYAEAKEQAFLEANGFRLVLEDASELAVNASMLSFQTGRTVPSAVCGAQPINKAMKSLSTRLISNIHPAVFWRIPGEGRIDRSFYEMVKIFENVPGKRIVKAIVLDRHDGKIAEFTTIPSHKRRFLIGAGPKQKEFIELTKTAKWAAKKPFYHEGTDTIVHFAETRTDFVSSQVQEKIQPLRAIALWRDGGNDPCWTILTNQKTGEAEDIVREYMSLWPYVGERAEEEILLSRRQDYDLLEQGEKAPGTIREICADLIDSLHRYGQREFFPSAYGKMDINHFITNIYGISGSVYEGDGVLTVSLDTEDSVYRKDLEIAVKRVNEHNIFAHDGRRVWLRA